MSSADFVHPAHQVAYERPSSRAEEALAQAMPLCATEPGPVNLTWNRPIKDLWPNV